MSKLYAHMQTDPGAIYGYDRITMQRWEISNRPRPTSKYSFELDNCVSTRRFIRTHITYYGGRAINCTYGELEPYILAK
jgi:hypothetical protein